MSIVTIDFGGSSTTALVHQDGELIDQLDHPSQQIAATPDGICSIISELDLKDETERVIVTGGKSQTLQASPDLPVRHVDELPAIASGACYLSGLDAVLAVSCGTGTAMVVASDGNARSNDQPHFQHVGGTGLGGGTLMGLGKLLCRTDTFSQLEDLARQGDTRQLDLLVEDIVGAGIGIIPADFTAANFAKAGQLENTDLIKKADLAAALMNLVSQNIARLAITLAQAHELSDIVCIGRVIESDYIQDIFRSIQQLFGCTFHFPREARYGAAWGAYLLATREPC